LRSSRQCRASEPLLGMIRADDPSTPSYGGSLIEVVPCVQVAIIHFPLQAREAVWRSSPPLCCEDDHPIRVFCRPRFWHPPRRSYGSRGGGTECAVFLHLLISAKRDDTNGTARASIKRRQASLIDDVASGPDHVVTCRVKLSRGYKNWVLPIARGYDVKVDVPRRMPHADRDGVRHKRTTAIKSPRTEVALRESVNQI
jgi:hypothetical protein